MTSAGVPAPQIMRILNDTLRAEQKTASTFQFATVCMTTISAARSEASFVVAGHPSPVLVTSDLEALTKCLAAPGSVALAHGATARLAQIACGYALRRAATPCWRAACQPSTIHFVRAS